MQPGTGEHTDLACLVSRTCLSITLVLQCLTHDCLVLTCAVLQVASVILCGIASGQFLLPNSSFLIGLLQTITAGLIPRRLLAVAWEGLLGLLSPLICSIVSAEHDGVARQGAARRFARLWAAGQAAGQGAPPPSE